MANPYLPLPNIKGDGYTLHDADTLRLRGGNPRGYRVAGIDAREMANPHENTPRQAGALEAQQAAAEFLARGQVETNRTGTDRHGRDLGTISSQGQDLGEYLVRNLHAVPAYADAAKYREAQFQADKQYREDPNWASGQAFDNTPLGDPQLFPERRLGKKDNLAAATLRGVDEMQGNLYGGGHALSRLIEQVYGTDLSGTKDWMKEGMDRNEVEAAENPASFKSFDDVKGLDDFGTYAAEMTLSSGMSQAPMLIGGAVSIGAKTILGRAAGAFLANSVSQAGEVESEQLGLDNPAPADEVVIAGGIRSALDVASTALGISKVMGKGSSESIKQAAGHILKAVGISAPFEGITEAAQEAIAIALRVQQDPDYDPALAVARLKESFIGGVVVGGTMTGAGTTGSEILRGINEQQTQTETEGEDPGEAPGTETLVEPSPIESTVQPLPGAESLEEPTEPPPPIESAVQPLPDAQARADKHLASFRGESVEEATARLSKASTEQLQRASDLFATVKGAQNARFKVAIDKELSLREGLPTIESTVQPLPGLPTIGATVQPLPGESVEFEPLSEPEDTPFSGVARQRSDASPAELAHPEIAESIARENTPYIRSADYTNVDPSTFSQIDIAYVRKSGTAYKMGKPVMGEGPTSSPDESGTDEEIGTEQVQLDAGEQFTPELADREDLIFEGRKHGQVPATIAKVLRREGPGSIQEMPDGSIINVPEGSTAQKYLGSQSVTQAVPVEGGYVVRRTIHRGIRQGFGEGGMTDQDAINMIAKYSSPKHLSRANRASKLNPNEGFEAGVGESNTIDMHGVVRLGAAMLGFSIDGKAQVYKALVEGVGRLQSMGYVFPQSDNKLDFRNSLELFRLGSTPITWKQIKKFKTNDATHSTGLLTDADEIATKGGEMEAMNRPPVVITEAEQVETRKMSDEAKAENVEFQKLSDSQKAAASRASTKEVRDAEALKEAEALAPAVKLKQMREENTDAERRGIRKPHSFKALQKARKLVPFQKDEKQLVDSWDDFTPDSEKPQEQKPSTKPRAKHLDSKNAGTKDSKFLRALADSIGLKTNFHVVDEESRDAMLKRLGKRKGTGATIFALKNATGPRIIYNDTSDRATDRVPIIYMPAGSSLTEMAHEFGHLVMRATVDRVINSKKPTDVALVKALFGEVNWGNPAEALKASEMFAHQMEKWASSHAVPRNIVERFFKKLGEALRKVWKALGSKKGAFSEFMEAMIDPDSVFVTDDVVAQEQQRAYDAAVKEAKKAKSRARKSKKGESPSEARARVLAERAEALKSRTGTGYKKAKSGKIPLPIDKSKWHSNSDSIREVLVKHEGISPKEALTVTARITANGVIDPKLSLETRQALVDLKVLGVEQTYQDFVDKMIRSEFLPKNTIGKSVHEYTGKEVYEYMDRTKNRARGFMEGKPVLGTINKTLGAIGHVVEKGGAYWRATGMSLGELSAAFLELRKNWHVFPGEVSPKTMKRVYLTNKGRSEKFKTVPFITLEAEIRALQNEKNSFFPKGLKTALVDVLGKLPHARGMAYLNAAKRLQVATAYRAISKELQEYTTKTRSKAELSPNALAIAEYFENLYGMFKASDVYDLHLAHREQYSPLSIDKDKWLANSDAVREVLVKHEGVSQVEALSIIAHIATTNGIIDPNLVATDVFASSVAAKRSRKLKLETQQAFVDIDVYSDDLHGAMEKAAHQLIKRATEQSRFGGLKKDTLGNVVKDAVFDPVANINQTIATEASIFALTGKGVNPQDMHRAVTKYFPALRGTLGGTIDPRMNSIMSWTHLGISLALLPLSTLSSIPDVGGIAVQAGVYKDPMRMLKDMGQVARYFKKGRKAELMSVAKMLGIIDDKVADHVLSESMQSEFMTPTTRIISEHFFNIIQMKRWTDFSRMLATGFAIDTMKSYGARIAKGESLSSELKDLPVTVSQIKAWYDAGATEESVVDFEGMGPAVSQWVDYAILRPSSATKPPAGADPRLKLFWQLKEFMYSFYYTTMKRAFDQMGKSENFATALPVIAMAAFMVPLAAAGYELRKVIAEEIPGALLGKDPKYRKPEGEDYIYEMLIRGGLLGPFTVLHDMYEADKHGSLAITALMGPTFSKSIELFDKGLVEFLVHTTPLLAQSRVLRDLVPRPTSE